MAMSYALLVHFDASPSARKRVQLAAGLAGRYAAALVGVAGRSYLPHWAIEETACPAVAHLPPAPEWRAK